MERNLKFARHVASRWLLSQFVAFAWIAMFACQCVYGAYEAPNNAAYGEGTYYSGITGTGLTLRGNLHNLISSNYTGRSYGDTRYAMGSGGDLFPAGVTPGMIDVNPSTGLLRLVYNGGNIAAGWDQGATWNREHAWPKSWLNLTSSQVSNSYVGPASDLFEIWPANPSVNSSRSNNGYGYYPNTTGSGGSYGNNTVAAGTFWYPGTYDAGELSRSMFYMATRYFNSANSSRGTDIQNLELVNGNPSLYNMGDLTSMLHWNYEYGVDNFERRRNALIYGKSVGSNTNDLNPSYFQGNRNPYIDHPEYVWAVYGTHKDGSNNVINNSQISVGGSINADGSSTAAVNLTPVIVGGTLSTSSVAFNKTGTDPTTFNIAASGNAVLNSGSVGSFAHPVVGVGQGIDFGTQSGSVTVGLNASTAAAGLKSGVLTVHNSDISAAAAAGQGSDDHDDTINISAAVLDHANASFAGGSNANSLTLNFGRIGQSSGTHQAGFNIFNLEATAGYTAGLNLNTITPSGSSAITSTLATFANLAAGSSSAFNANVDTTSLGTLSTTFTLGLSDVALSGAAATAPLTLTVSAIVNKYAPGDFNLDHHVDASDLAPMLAAIADPSDYETANSLSPTDFMDIADINWDGTISGADVQSFENLLINGQGVTSTVPEPSSMVLLALGSLALLRGYRRASHRI
jgi:endonuclease I